MGESGEPLLFLRKRFLRFRAFELMALLCPLRMNEVMTVTRRLGEDLYPDIGVGSIANQALPPANLG